MRISRQSKFNSGYYLMRTYRERCSIEPRDQIYAKGYGFLSFA